MSETEKLRKQLGANVNRLSYLDDKASVLTGIGVMLTSLFGFTVMLSFLALWIDSEYGQNAPLPVELTFWAGLAAWVVAATVLLSAFGNILLGIKLRKETSALSRRVEASDLDFQVKQLATLKAKEQADHLARQNEERVRAAQAASDAREAQARAEVVAMGEKRLAEQRKLEEAEQRNKTAQNPGYRKSERPNQYGGTSTQGKGSSPRKEL